MENKNRKDTFSNLQSYYNENKSSNLKLQNLLQDQERTRKFKIEGENYILDYSKQHLDSESLTQLFKIAEDLNLKESIQAMYRGDKINTTEGRSVLHTALRMQKTAKLEVDGQNVIEDVHKELEKMREFSERVRSGKFKGCTGKRINTILSIGIGGSYLGVLTAYEAFKCTKEGYLSSRDFKALFLADPDPLDFHLKVQELDPESTLVVILSKTFTTAETMLNSNTAKTWILDAFKVISPETSEADVIKSHFCAVSTNLEGTSQFGIDNENVFQFWDWVGGRFSVSSAIGVLSLSVIFGYEIVESFLEGMRNIDENFINEVDDFTKNTPVILGLLGFFNSTIEGYECRAILPYNQGLRSFFNHVQQVSMESNGKTVDLNGNSLDGYQAGYINFGESGTKGQHSFFQLLHQGKNYFF